MMRKLFMLSVAPFIIVTANCQLTGIKTIPGTYATIAAAVAALNTQGVGAGGVTFNVAAGYSEASADSIYLTATGSASNPVVFQKSGAGINPKITRTGTGLLPTSIFGGSGDAVFIAESSDYLTIDGIDIATADAGIEYGYYLRKASGINGCRNDTIRNCNITMTKGTSAYVIGIFSSNNFKGQSPAADSGIRVTSITGRNENIGITGNRISNVSSGIYAKGFVARLFTVIVTPSDFYDQNFTVGSEGAGNSVQNFGNDMASSYGIYLTYQNGASIQYNTINNTANGGTPSVLALYGIRHLTSGKYIMVTISNNSVNVTGSNPSSTDVLSPALSAISNNVDTGSITINNNTLTLNNLASSQGFYYYIDNEGGGSIATAQITNNKFMGSTINATRVTFIENSNASTTDYTVSGNSTVGTLRTSGSVTCYIDQFTNIAGADNIHNNNFSNIILTGVAGITFTGISCDEVNFKSINIYNNTISNITGTNTGSFVAIRAAITSTQNIFGNRIFSIATAGDITGISLFNNPGAPPNSNVYKNLVSDLSTSGAAQKVTGMSIGGAMNVYNNLLGNLYAPASGSTSESVIGITVSNGSAYNSKLYYNSLYLNASSSSANFSTTALLFQNNSSAGTGGLDSKNNIIVNTSTPKGTGLTVAYKKQIPALTNYDLTSNNNLYYAGVPGDKNLIHYDGTNADQTLAQYKARVSPRDANSVTENPPFLSTDGNSPFFLHINSTEATQVNDGGTAIAGYTDDFDSDLRNSITPDIGADEIQSALPVLGLSLRGERGVGVNNISWSTLTEINNRGFELQRSADGNTFSNIGFVNSRATGGNSMSALQYTFDDIRQNNGSTYYRLRQVDKDGRHLFSNVVLIKGLKVVKPALLNVYPNPAITNLNIVLALPANDRVSFIVTDLEGKVVVQKAARLLSGENNIALNVARLLPGTYYIKLVAEKSSETAVQKFVKQ